MEFKAVSKYQRLSPSKARDLARRVQGLPLKEAYAVTEFSERKAARLLDKTLKSAAANAASSEKIGEDELWVKKAVVEEGPRLKRYWPRSRGGASPILRRMCHIRVVLTDEPL